MQTESIETQYASSSDTTGEKVLDQTRDFVSRFCLFPSQAALDAVTLWIAHTHVVDVNGALAFETSPRMAFLSDEPASGKTRALEIVGLLARRGRQVIDPTPPSFAMGISERHATILIDEIDILFGGGGAKSVLRSLLNAGYKRGACWERVNRDDVSVFAPVAMAGLGQRFTTSAPLSTLRSRTIRVHMRSVAGKAEPYRSREHDKVAEALASDLATWITGATGVILEDWPDMPSGIEDRLAEVWEPLFMVANVAGGHWPESVRLAAEEMALGHAERDLGPPLIDRLIEGLRQVFLDTDKLSTVTIVGRLRSLPDTPWSALWPHDATAPKELAAMLAPLGPQPVRVREDGHQLRGYTRESLEHLWDEPCKAHDVPEVVGLIQA